MFSSEEVKKLAALRSHTTRGIKKNFSSWYRPNLACVLGCSDEDDQPHLLHCKPLLAKLDPEQRDLIGGIEYTFYNFPLNISLDYKPYYSPLNRDIGIKGFGLNEFGVSVRYVIQ